MTGLLPSCLSCCAGGLRASGRAANLEQGAGLRQGPPLESSALQDRGAGRCRPHPALLAAELQASARRDREAHQVHLRVPQPGQAHGAHPCQGPTVCSLRGRGTGGTGCVDFLPVYLHHLPASISAMQACCCASALKCSLPWTAQFTCRCCIIVHV